MSKAAKKYGRNMRIETCDTNIVQAYIHSLIVDNQKQSSTSSALSNCTSVEVAHSANILFSDSSGDVSLV